MPGLQEEKRALRCNLSPFIRRQTLWPRLQPVAGATNQLRWERLLPAALPELRLPEGQGSREPPGNRDFGGSSRSQLFTFTSRPGPHGQREGGKDRCTIG